MGISQPKNQNVTVPGRITNGQVIEFLNKLPETCQFGHLENDEDGDRFLRRLYNSLRGKFSSTTTTSRAIHTRILKIQNLEVIGSLHARFPEFKSHPMRFWELPGISPQSYDNQATEKRVKLFFENAAHLDSRIQEQSILRRFIDVGAWKLFQRAQPSSSNRVFQSNVDRFLNDTGVQCFEMADSVVYRNIIRRGQRYERFCQKLVLFNHPDDEIERTGTIGHSGADLEGKNEIFGPLFFPSIPDAM